MAANFDITVERVGDDVVRVEVLGSDEDGQCVAHLLAEMSLVDLALIGRLVGEAAEDAARTWPGVTLPERPPPARPPIVQLRPLAPAMQVWPPAVEGRRR